MEEKKENICLRIFPARYVFAIHGSVGMAIIYGLKVNLSVAMVAMVNHTYILGGNFTSRKKEDDCLSHSEDIEEQLESEDGPFKWSSTLQGVLLSCYFWGYLVSQIPCARIAEVFSAKWVFFFSAAINIVCTILTPVMTKFHYIGLIVMRVLEGIGGGATFPAMHCMIAHWAPPNERFLISTIIYVGTSFGTAVSILLAGVLCHEYGWESVFYSMGGLSCIWMVFWIILIYDDPKKHRFISTKEREMLISSLGTLVHEDPPPVPWKSVLTSIPFWAIFIAHVCSNCGWYMFLIDVPLYFKHVLGLDVKKNATVTALPYFILMFFSIILGKTLDTLRAKKILSTSVARKVATGIASVIPLLCLIGLCYVGCRHTLAIALMTIGITAMGAMFAGFLSNHIDIAPAFAATLIALTNTVATLPGIIVPMAVGIVTEEDQSIKSWRLIFFTTTVFFIIEVIVYTIFGSGEVQSWANKSET